jgi:cytochrome c-type biogenesis protein CcmH/NrfG
VLLSDTKNVKALYRSARACLATDKLEEADDALSRALKLDPSNSSFINLKLEIARRKSIYDSQNRQIQATQAKKRDSERALKVALKVLSSIYS